MLVMHPGCCSVFPVSLLPCLITAGSKTGEHSLLGLVSLSGLMQHVCDMFT